MSDEEGPVEGERRKILAKSLPFMINAAWEAHAALSPMNLASTAVSEYQKMEKDAKLQENEVRSLVKAIENLNLKSEGRGRLSLTLTRNQIVDLVGYYLVTKFLTEGSWGSKFKRSTLPEFDVSLSLANRTIYAKFVREKMNDDRLFGEVDKAETLNPCEVWVFSLEKDRRFDVRFDPVFLSETKILRGRFRLGPATEVLQELLKGKFSVDVQAGEGGGNEENQFRFLLTRVVTH
jgi:ribosomal protein S15P/S13E